ncbi:hypothetical protein EJ08DRAFT_639399 [Tothia fuscella]|uniref:FAD-binding domain-containing protein n=1 Tax=Tothia fuscella TaxID=1048955 RepID=A0A9P4NKE8_9PEZI|nr:hypothetical protein EJ08DRAFT_639399 [Tothia fuscella]
MAPSSHTNGAWDSIKLKTLNGETDGATGPAIEVPILIVGSGPTGLLMAYMLSRLGVKCLVVEKYFSRLEAPKAHAINPRSLEIVRQFGLDTTTIRRLGSSRHEAFWVNFVTNLSGQKIGSLPYERMDKEVLADTPEMIHNIPQPVLEQFIADHLVHDSNVEIKKGSSFVSCTQEDDRVSTIVEERGSKSRYSDSYEAMMTIHINTDLRPVLGTQTGMLHWIMDPAVSGFIIGYDLSGNQVLICNFDAKKHPAESWTSDDARRVVTPAIGKEIPFEIVSFRPWISSRKVATRFQEGSVFLCGDAAHAFPPTGGLGLNCGLADVHNLAYKLAGNLQGWGGVSLLQSYESERRHIAELYSQQSVKNGLKIFGFLKTLGLAADDDVESARQMLLKKVNEPEMQATIEEGVESQREHFDNLELHIGYVYGSNYQPPHASHFTPKFVPGGRLPHAWIRPSRLHIIDSLLKPVDVSYVWDFSFSEQEARRFSTLDLVPRDGFALFVTKEGGWHRRFERIKQRLFLRNIKIELFVVGEHFEFAIPVDGEKWAERAGLAEGGGLLIRPDQHILMRFKVDAGGVEVVNSVLEHLGVEPTDSDEYRI